MRGPLFIILLLTLLGAAACQATTGYLVGKSQYLKSSCEPMPKADVSVDWSVFSAVVEAKNCPGAGAYKERYKLTNGWGVYQEANTGYVYFYEVSERSFREALALGFNKAFADKATTIKIHYPKLKNRPTIFAQTRSSGRNVIYFVMNAGFPQEEGWSKYFHGLLYDDDNMSADDFRQYFLERLRVFDTPAAANFILSASRTNRISKTAKVLKTKPQGSPTVRPITVDAHETSRNVLDIEPAAQCSMNDVVKGRLHDKFGGDWNRYAKSLTERIKKTRSSLDKTKEQVKSYMAKLEKANTELLDMRDNLQMTLKKGVLNKHLIKKREYEIKAKDALVKTIQATLATFKYSNNAANSFLFVLKENVAFIKCLAGKAAEGKL